MYLGVNLGMRPNKKLAKRLRKLGLGPLVDSRRLRTMLGLPIRDIPEALAERRHSSSPNHRFENPIGPLVSIIVPSYNVEEYLADAVGTVLAQSYENIEVIIVNDGSKDATGAIADDLAKQDARVHVVHKSNAGLGAARNTGLSLASGKYVSFIDSDDQIPRDAISSMVDSLESSGSDFVAGSMERFDQTRVWVPEWAKEVHAVDRHDITAEVFPPILWDVFACNKLFRRDSWDRYVGLFPEGVLYEDQEATARLYVEGARFDVLSKIVYRWRLREDGSSITQDKLSITNLEQRIGVARTVQAVIETSDDRNLVDYWYAKLLGDDLYWYYREVPRVGTEYWDVLTQGVRYFSQGIRPGGISRIPIDRRILASLVANGDRDTFVQALMHFQEHGAHWIAALDRRARIHAHIPELAETLSLLDDEILEVNDNEVELQSAITRVQFDRDGSIVLHGYAHFLHLPRNDDRLVQISLVETLGDNPEEPRSSFVLDVEPTLSREADIAARDPYRSYSDGGFRVAVPAQIADTIAEQIRNPESHWSLQLTICDGAMERVSQVIPLKSAAQVGPVVVGATTASGNRFRVSAGPAGVGVSVDSPLFYAETVRVNDRSFSLSVVGREPLTESLKLRIFDKNRVLTETQLTKEERGTWGAHVVLPGLAPISAANITSYSFGVVRENGKVELVGSGEVAARMPVAGVYAVTGSAAGDLKLERYAQFASVSKVHLEEDGRSIVFTGSYNFDREQVRHGVPSFGLKNGTDTYFPSRMNLDESAQTYEVEFALYRPDIDQKLTAIPVGNYALELMLPNGHRLPAKASVFGEKALLAQLPKELMKQQTRIELRQTRAGNGVSVLMATPFMPNERGQFSQRVLRQNVALLRSKPVREGVLFESFGGRGISDSPKALDRVVQQMYPGLPRYWTVRDHSVAVPDGAIPLIQYSKAWHEALHSTRFLVNNNNFPFHFRKHPEQIYVQTWHGTPLKRIGNDVPAANLSLSYRALMQREAEQYWDFMLAQSPWAGGILSNAFNYQGVMLDQGYPRNDALFGYDAEIRRRTVREHFSLSDTQTVVLYAPTWRDNLKAPNGGYLQPKYLDLSAIHKAYGRDVIILQRGHVNTAASHRRVVGPNVIDVSKYPDINDLYLAADLLVTDYSSVQFDFVNTGKPVIYLTPDLATYRDIVRGFYFDLEATAPGPLLQNTQEVIEALRELRSVTDEFHQQYESFKSRFAGMDDRDASVRVASVIFEQ